MRTIVAQAIESVRRLVLQLRARPSIRTATRRLWPLNRVKKQDRLLLIILVLILASGGALVSSMLNMKVEIVDGPNRVLKQVATPDDGWLLQKGATNLVDDSFVPREAIDQLQADGYQTVGFTRSYRAVHVGGKVHEAMVLDVPAPLDKGKQGIVTDKTLGAKMGSPIEIAGQTFTVTGITSGTSALGKEGVFLSPENYLLLGGPSDLVSGVFIDGGVPVEYSSDYEVFTAPEFERSNYEYWFTQGGILPLTVAGILSFSTLANAVCLLALSFALRRRILTLMRAAGSSNWQVTSSELLYLLLVWAISWPVQLLFYKGFVSVSVLTTSGYRGALTMGEFAIGSLCMLAVILVYWASMHRYARRALQSHKLAGEFTDE